MLVLSGDTPRDVFLAGHIMLEEPAAGEEKTTSEPKKLPVKLLNAAAHVIQHTENESCHKPAQ